MTSEPIKNSGHGHTLQKKRKAKLNNKTFTQSSVANVWYVRSRYLMSIFGTYLYGLFRFAVKRALLVSAKEEEGGWAKYERINLMICGNGNKQHKKYDKFISLCCLFISCMTSVVVVEVHRNRRRTRQVTLFFSNHISKFIVLTTHVRNGRQRLHRLRSCDSDLGKTWRRGFFSTTKTKN